MRWGSAFGIPAKSLYLCDALSISSTRDEGEAEGEGQENEGGQGVRLIR